MGRLSCRFRPRTLLAFASFRWRGGADGGEAEELNKVLRRVFFAALLLPLAAFAEEGSIYEASGLYCGRVSESGTIRDQSGLIRGRVSQSGTIRDDSGLIVGRVSDGGTIRDTSGLIIGRISR